jgi:hypothetical protein
METLASELLVLFDEERLFWEQRLEQLGHWSKLAKNFSTEVADFDVSGKRLFELGRILSKKNAIDEHSGTLLGRSENFFHRFHCAKKAIKFYQMQLRACRSAVDAWSICATRAGLYVKDLRKLVGEMVWGERFLAKYKTIGYGHCVGLASPAEQEAFWKQLEREVEPHDGRLLGEKLAELALMPIRPVFDPIRSEDVDDIPGGGFGVKGAFRKQVAEVERRVPDQDNSNVHVTAVLVEDGSDGKTRVEKPADDRPVGFEGQSLFDKPANAGVGGVGTREEGFNFAPPQQNPWGGYIPSQEQPGAGFNFAANDLDGNRPWAQQQPAFAGDWTNAWGGNVPPFEHPDAVPAAAVPTVDVPDVSVWGAPPAEPFPGSQEAAAFQEPAVGWNPQPDLDADDHEIVLKPKIVLQSNFDEGQHSDLVLPSELQNPPDYLVVKLAKKYRVRDALLGRNGEEQTLENVLEAAKVAEDDPDAKMMIELLESVLERAKSAKDEDPVEASGVWGARRAWWKTPFDRQEVGKLLLSRSESNFAMCVGALLCEKAPKVRGRNWNENNQKIGVANQDVNDLLIKAAQDGFAFACAEMGKRSNSVSLCKQAFCLGERDSFSDFGVIREK